MMATRAKGERGKLTPRQRECYEVIAAYVRREKKPPTIRHIGEVMGGINMNAVTGFVKALRRKGWVKEVTVPEGGTTVLARSLIPVTEDGSCPYCGKGDAAVPVLRRLREAGALIEGCLQGGDRSLLRQALALLAEVKAEVEEAV